jgi:hypothetical protein
MWDQKFGSFYDLVNRSLFNENGKIIKEPINALLYMD